MAIILDQSGANILDEAGNPIFDELGPVMPISVQSTGGTISLISGTYGANTLTMGTITQAGNGLVAFIGWTAGNRAIYVNSPACCIADSAGNLWKQVAITAPGTTDARCAIWMTVNAQSVSWISLGFTGYAQSAEWLVAEFSGMPQNISLDYSLGTSVIGTAQSLTGIASASDLGFAVFNTDNTGFFTVTPPAGWTSLGTVTGPVGAIVPYYNTAIAAGTATFSFTTPPTASPSAESLALCAVKASASPPAQYDIRHPLNVVEAAFGASPGDTTKSVDWTFSSEYTSWTDISTRVLGDAGQGRITTSRGRQYELQQEEAGEMTAFLDNHDGAFTPTNPGSPYYSNALNSNMSFQSSIAPWTGANGASVSQSGQFAYASGLNATSTASLLVVPGTNTQSAPVSFVHSTPVAAAVSVVGTVSAAVSTGQQVLVGTYTNGASTTVSLVDSKGNTYTQIGSVTTITNRAIYVYSSTLASGLTTSDTLTFTVNNASSVTGIIGVSLTQTAGTASLVTESNAVAGTTHIITAPYTTALPAQTVVFETNGNVGPSFQSPATLLTTISGGGGPFFTAAYLTSTLPQSPAATATTTVTTTDQMIAVTMLPVASTANPEAVSESTIPINPNYTYTASFWAMAPGGVPGSAIAGIAWYLPNGTLISTSTGTGVAVSASTASTAWVQATVTATPPGSATTAQVIARLGGTNPQFAFVSEAALVTGGSAVSTGLVAMETPVRVTSWWQGRQYPVWMGYVERWPQAWPELPQWGFSNITATDAISVAAASSMFSALVGETLLDNPIGYLPCNEQYTSANVGATPQFQFLFGTSPYYAPADANGLIALNKAAVNQTSGVFFDGSGGQQVSTGLAMNFFGDDSTGMGANGYQGQVTGQRGPSMLYKDGTLASLSWATGFTVEFWFTWGGATAATSLLTGYTGPSAFMGTISSAGAIFNVGLVGGTALVTTLMGNTATVPTNITPNVPQQCVLVFFQLPNSVPDMSAYLNGSPNISLAIGNGTASVPSPQALVLGPGRYSYDVNNFSANYAADNFAAGHLSVYPYQLSTQRIAAHYQAGAAGWSGISSAYRFAQILTWAQIGVKRGAYDLGDATGVQEITQIGPAYQLNGSSASDAINAVALSEGGQYYVKPDGTIIYLERAVAYNQPVTAVLGDNATAAPDVLNANPGFLFGNVSGWTGSTGVTVAYSNAQVYGQYGSLLFTPSGTASILRALSPAGNVTPGGSYTTGAWIYSPAGGTVFTGLQWSGGSFSAGISLAPASWEFVTASGTIPAGAGVTTASMFAGAASQFYMAYGFFMTASAEVPFLKETIFDFDNTYIYNDITASQLDGPNQLIEDESRSPASQRAYFRRSALNFQSNVVSPYDVADVTSWSLGEFSQPVLRASAIKLHASSDPFVIFGPALSLDIGDIVRVIRRPVGGAAISELGIVERVQCDIGSRYFYFTYQISPYPASSVLCADTTGFDTPGTTTLGW